MGLVNTFGEYVSKVSYDDLPAEVVAATKERVLDTLGAALLGYSQGIHKPFMKVLSRSGGAAESTIIGEGVKLPCGAASLINGSMPIDVADGHRFSGCHPSVAVIPAALAIGELQNVTGKGLITAIVLGYEVMLRVGQVVYVSTLARGFHPTSVVGCLGAAAAASKLLNLDEQDTARALALASLSASGLMDAFKGRQPFVHFQLGRASESGVISALLAKEGAGGNDTILEKSLIPAICDKYDLDAVAKDLGKEYLIQKTYVKRHSGCRHVHAPLDAFQQLVEQHKLQIEDIAQVKAKTYSVAINTEIHEPKTGSDAQFNLPFAISVAAIFGNAFPEQFTDEKLKDERVQKFMKKVKVEHSPDLDKDYPQKRGTVVDIITKDNQVYSNKLDFAIGEPECPLSATELQGKFRHLASKVLGDKKTEMIIEFVDRLEAAETISNLFEWLEEDRTSEVKK